MKRKLILDLSQENIMSDCDNSNTIIVHVTENEKTEKKYQYQSVQNIIKTSLSTNASNTHHLTCYCQSVLDYLIHNVYQYDIIYITQLEKYSFYDSRFLLFLDCVKKHLTKDGIFHFKTMNHMKYLNSVLAYETKNNWTFNKIRNCTKAISQKGSLWTHNLVSYYLSEFTDLSVLAINHLSNDQVLEVTAKRKEETENV